MIKSVLSQHAAWACLKGRKQLYKLLLLTSFDLEMLAVKGASDELCKLIDTLNLRGYYWNEMKLFKFKRKNTWDRENNDYSV